MSTQGELQFVGTALGVEAELDIRVLGGPLSIRLAPRQGISLKAVWDEVSSQLEQWVGFGLPSLNGPWTRVIGLSESLIITPTLWISPSGSDASKFAATIQLEFNDPIQVGGTWTEGPFTLEMSPSFTVEALIFGYDSAAGGLTVKARISNPTTPVPPPAGGSVVAASPPGNKTQIVSFPFPVPAQQKVPLFTLHYLGIGQRVGPEPAPPSAPDPMLYIFDRLESQLVGDDPAQVLTTLAKTFYHPDRNWFIGLDVELRGFRIMLLFNDPAMYGLRISVAMQPPTPFSGFLFEILYQKLSPNLGVYYGALTLPYFMRRIVISGVVLILPGFAIWIYTNGDFRVNVGWPLGDSSIAVQVGPLVGAGGFYFARLRSADNPGVQPTVDYNPILAFGIGLTLYIRQSFNASIFTASIEVSLTATLQGLLAWKAGQQGQTASITRLPDHYWFAGTAGLAVLIQGSVDFAIIKASVTISFNANVGLALETGYGTQLSVSADVSVQVSVKVVFFTIHLSFSTSVSATFEITAGNGTPASVNGPLDPDLQGIIGPSHDALVGEELRFRLGRMRSLMAGQRSRSAGRVRPAVRAAPGSPGVIDLWFVLQPTAVYTADGGGSFAAIASLFVEAPEPGASPALTTPFESLMVETIEWLLSMTDSALPYSERFARLMALLGAGSDAPLGDWATWRQALDGFVGSLTFSVGEIDASQSAPVTAALLPMLDVLRLSYEDEGGNEIDVDFDTYGPVPAGYPSLVNRYYQDVGWMGTDTESAASGLTLRAQVRSSFAAFVLADYFLMQSRNAVQSLYTAAGAYEQRKEQQLHADVARLARDPYAGWDLAERLNEYLVDVSGDAELEALLAGFDYASAAGLGSRYMLNGLQLPVPESPDETAPLNVLTGQQFAVPAGAAAATATLSLSPTAGAPAGSVIFSGGSPASAACSVPLPPALPPMPSPEWSGVTASPPDGGNGDITLAPLPGVSPTPLYYATKNQVSWSSPSGARTILPLPQPLLSRLAGALGVASPPLGLSVLSDPPPSSNRPPSPASPPAPPIAATAGLLIRLSIAQVPSQRTAIDGTAGSPASGSPAGGSAAQYLRYVYQVSGADEATRDLIFEALSGDLDDATITLLYTVGDNGSPGPTRSGTAGLFSTVLDPATLLYKTNLSTLNQVPAAGVLMAARAAATADLGGDAAPVTDVPGFLRLLWEVSVVNAPGFFLLYRDAAGDDLPGSIFSSPGAEGGSAAQFDVLVQFAGQPSSPVTLGAGTNCVVVDQGALDAAVYLAVLDPGGAPALSYAPTYAAGSIGFSLLWHRAAEAASLVPVNELYHLVQYRLTGGGGYRDSVWSLPVGPSEDNGPYAGQSSPADWSYVQTIAVSRFLGSPAANRYDVIGLPVEVGLRVVDVYGDALPVGASTEFTPRYQDPLFTIAQWPGVVWSWRIVPGTGGAATALLAMRFDPDSVVPPGSPHTGGPSVGAQWQASLAQYQLILDQLTDPGTTIALGASLSPTPLMDGETLRGRLAGLAGEIARAIQDGLDASPPLVREVDDALVVDVPFAGVAALPDNIVPVTFTVRLSRDPALLDPDALAHLPAALAAAYSIPPLQSEGGSPGDSPASSVALEFEAAFQGFDGAGGVLKLAERAGVQNGADSAGVQTLWAVRWSRSAGISLDFDPTPVFFARAPLSNVPLSGTFGGQTWNNVDLDAWGRSFLAAFDDFLSPRLAGAVAALDVAWGTTFYDDITGIKESLAGTIVKGVQPLFTDQADGDLTGARDRLRQALLSTLSSAYTVSTIVQVPATVALGATPSPITSPARAPRLYGSVGPSSASAPGQAREYTLTPGELGLIPGANWMTTLLSVATPGDSPAIAMPLDYEISYLQYDFEVERMYLDYVPSSWLKFQVPAGAPLQVPINKDAHIPVPLISLPVSPNLLGHTASAAPLGSGSGSPTLANEIEEALRWEYHLDLVPNWSGQDTLYLDVSYNAKPTALDFAALADAAAAREQLADALAYFLVWYSQHSGELPLIAAEAFPGAGGSPAASPGQARELIADFARLAGRVQQGWDALFALTMMAAVELDVLTDSFRVQPNQVFSGRDDDGGNPLYWPVVNGSAAYAGDHARQGADGWWDQPAELPFPRTEKVSLDFGPIDIAGRQSGCAAAWLVRNANILEPYTTAGDFVYKTQTVSFTSSVVPLIRRGTLDLVPPLSSLTDTVAALLAPIANTGAGLTTTLRVEASYGYAVAGTGGAALMARDAILLADELDVGGSPGQVGEVADALASGIAAWHAQSVRVATGAELQFAITLFGTLGARRLPLVQIGCVPISVDAVAPAWWTT